MTIAEGVSRSIRYKSYSTGVITANTQPTSSSDPGASGGQILRRVSTTLNLKKDTYQSNEVRTDRQIQDFRHGVKRVDGSISGELSPATYFDFIEAACRGTKSASVVTLGPSVLTSLSADNSTSKFVAAAGDPVSSGLRTGDVFRLTGMSDTDNNSKNFLITGFSGSNNRNILVYPAPDTMSADTTFTLTTVGKSIYVPSSSFVSRKFGVEVYSSDVDVSQFYTECRVNGFNIQLPATGMGTIEVPLLGRDMEVLTGGSAPFYSAPTAETTTGCIAAVNGLLRVSGTTIGVITGINVQMNLNGSSDAVVGQNFVPEIVLGRANVSGQFTAMLQDETFINYFKSETEISILLYLTASSAAAADAITIYMPRLKVGGADVGTTGEGSQIITMPFQALKADGTTVGDVATTIRIVDTAAT